MFKCKVYIVVLFSCVSLSMAFCVLLIDFTKIELMNFHAQLTHIRCIVLMSNSLHAINKGMQPMGKSVRTT